MKKSIFFLCLLATLFSDAQLCSGGRFQNYIFTGITFDSVTYSTPYSLKMDIYQPAGDVAAARPLIIFAHEGTFVAGTREDDSTIDSLCQRFAKRGYVTASIDYRLGSVLNMASDSTYALATILGAMQDAKAAIRYFKKDASTSNTFRIDTNNIFMGGNSAGAVMGLHAAYITSLGQCDAAIQSFFSSNGGLSGNSGNPGYSDNFKGVINLAGGLSNPAFIIPGSRPVVSAQGDQDAVSPYYCADYASAEIGLRVCGLGSLQPYIAANVADNESLVFTGAAHVPWDANAGMLNQVDTLITGFLFSQVCGNVSTCTPSVSITASSSSICSGDTVTFTANVVNGGTNPVCVWYNGSSQQITGLTWTTNALAQGNSISCNLTSNASCASPTTATSNSILVTVNATPVVTISQNGSVLTANGTGTIVSYQWLLNGNTINGAIGRTYVPTQAGIYEVAVSGAGGCNAVSTGFIVTNGTSCSGGRFQDYMFSNVTVDSVTYSTLYGLKMDIYQPVGDVASSRPLIILAHEGSFISGTREEDLTIDSLCMRFAERGYVTASIDYRLGTANNMVVDSSYALATILGAMQDAKAAIRYFKHDASTTNTFKIDTNNIFMGGNSSGAIMGLHAAYITSLGQCDAAVQSFFNSNGGLSGNSGNAGYSDNFKGVINLAGGLFNPAFITPGSIPVVSAQGDADAVDPYYCSDYEQGAIALRVCGLGSMQPYIAANVADNESLVFTGAGHVPWDANAAEFNQVDTLITGFLLRQVCTGAISSLQLSFNVPASICQGASVVLSTTVSGGSVPYSYTWSVASGNTLSCNNCYDPTASVYNNSAFTVTVTDANNASVTGSISFTVNVFPQQQICLVTPDSTNTENTVVWEKADKYATDSFFIYRAATPDSNYIQVGAVCRDSLSEFNDLSAQPSLMSYRYRMNVKDTCGVFSSFSDYHQTIYLSYVGSGGFVWTPYVIENESSPVSQYDFYRDSLGNGDWVLLAIIPNTQTGAGDPYFSQYPFAHYKVVVNLNNPCNPTRGISTITSNVLTHAQAVAEVSGLATVTNGKISLVPNPAHNMFEVINSDAGNKINSLYVCDQLGNKLRVPYTISTANNISVDISDIASGLYYVVLNYGNNNAVAKFVKY